MMRNMTEVARLLKTLKDLSIPVLWRPFHEFSGDWFWWGKHGPNAFKALWALMYDQFTRVHGLDNLIWVLGWAGKNADPAWATDMADGEIASEVGKVAERLRAEGEHNVDFVSVTGLAFTGCHAPPSTADDARISAALSTYIDAHPEIRTHKQPNDLRVVAGTR